MAKPGPKPRRAANPTWTPELAYACGLMATDGCLYSDGRHMSLTSNDIDQLETFKKCLGLTNKISWKRSGHTGEMGTHVQFGNASLYRWFITIGITPQKTFTIDKVLVPDHYFFDYLRGEFDGDGSSHGYWDSRWYSSVCIYLQFASASLKHLEWLNESIYRLRGVSGMISPGSRCYRLKIAKRQARLIYKAMYYTESIPFLKRKKDKLDRQWVANELAKQKIRPRELIKGAPILKIA